MSIFVDSLLNVGLMVGFEYYNPDEDFDYYELQLSLLIIRLTFVWH